MERCEPVKSIYAARMAGHEEPHIGAPDLSESSIAEALAMLHAARIACVEQTSCCATDCVELLRFCVGARSQPAFERGGETSMCGSSKQRRVLW